MSEAVFFGPVVPDVLGDPEPGLGLLECSWCGCLTVPLFPDDEYGRGYPYRHRLDHLPVITQDAFQESTGTPQTVRLEVTLFRPSVLTPTAREYIARHRQGQWYPLILPPWELLSGDAI